MATMHADKHAFEGFGILYYPIANTEAELAEIAKSATDADMAFATTCVANMNGTGYALLPTDIAPLAGVHGWMASQVGPEWADQLVPNPAADIRELVPAITTPPMYPGFPREVLGMDEALYRFHQMVHYASTYGVELVSILEGMPVTVSRGWLPHDGDAPGTQPARSGDYNILVDAKILKLVLSREGMRTIVLERLAQPTRMHEAEIHCAVKLLAAPGETGSVPIAFHENMLGLVQEAAQGTGLQLRRMLERTAQHPGDVLKAITHVRSNQLDGRKRLANRQKKAFCQALDGFTYEQLAENIAAAHPEDQRSLNYLSVARFGGEALKQAIAAVEAGQAKSWNAQVEQRWSSLMTDGPDELLAMYRQRPGLLLRSITRMLKQRVPAEKILEAALSVADEYSPATLVRTLTIMEGKAPLNIRIHEHPHESYLWRDVRRKKQEAAYVDAARIVRKLLQRRLVTLDTPLRGKHVYVDSGDFSLEGSVVMPNDVGDTGTAYPPTGMAFRLPDDATVRFFTFWDDRKNRVDVDLHFNILNTDGTHAHVGWNGNFRKAGTVMSGDITHSQDAAEYLDLDVRIAREAGVDYVTQRCHIYSGAGNWGDIETCFSGACIVESLENRSEDKAKGSQDPAIYQAENVIFRDDMTGAGRVMVYAYIDVTNGYVRLLRGTNYPFNRTAFTLDAFIDMLLAAQGATRVYEPEDADVTLSVGRTDDEAAICLIDEGFFLR